MKTITTNINVITITNCVNCTTPGLAVFVDYDGVQYISYFQIISKPEQKFGFFVLKYILPQLNGEAASC